MTSQLPLIGLLATIACGHPVPPTAPPVRTVELQLDYTPLFGDVSSASIYDPRLIEPGLFDRVMIEPDLLGSRPEHAEVWTRRLMLTWLGRKDCRIIGPPLPDGVEPRQPCPVGGCFDPVPTSLLRAVSFVSGTDTVDVVVQQVDVGQVSVGIRVNPTETSLCARDLTFELGYVELSATVQRMRDGAIVAMLHEIALLPSNEKLIITAELPDPEVDRAGFCGAVERIFAENPDLQRSDWRYADAARSVLKQGFDPLFLEKPPAAAPD